MLAQRRVRRAEEEADHHHQVVLGTGDRPWQVLVLATVAVEESQRWPCVGSSNGSMSSVIRVGGSSKEAMYSVLSDFGRKVIAAVIALTFRRVANDVSP